MAGITGQADTFDTPNYVGELFAISREDTPLLSAIGGLTGGEETTSKDFEWQGYDLRDAAANNVVLEGADAPTAQARVRASYSNVCEIHHEAVNVSYTKQAAIGNRSGLNIAGTNPVTDEFDWQVEQALKQVARDVELSFIAGEYAKPADNSAPRKTRGLIEAATTVTNGGSAEVTLATSAAADDIIDTAAAHGFFVGDQVIFTALTGGGGEIVVGTTYYVVSASHGAQTFRVAATAGGTPIDFSANITAGTVVKTAALTETKVLDLLQTVWELGGIREQEGATLAANGWLKRMLSKIFITDKGYAESTRNVGGVDLQTIETDFGRLNLMLHPRMPRHKLLVASLEQCAPVFLNIPDKGFLFVEQLAKTGASERAQLYGEVGLKYGNPNAHAVLENLATIVPPTS